MAIKGLKKTQGHDFNFYNSTAVSWAQFGAPDGYTLTDGYGPDLAITFSTQGVMFTNETPGSVVEYSFNGTTVHGVLDGANSPVSTTRVVMFNNRVVSLIWFRLKSGGTATITTTAWGIR